MNPQYIYLVTGVQIDTMSQDYEIIDTRCFTWYTDIEDAKKHPNECWVDQRGYYQYIVIERNSGIDSMPEDLTWFVYNHENDKYEEIDTPERYKNTPGFTIG